ncbi:30S ribosomal protein S10, chloroplastic, partial [Tanacetum coccineum]
VEDGETVTIAGADSVKFVETKYQTIDRRKTKTLYWHKRKMLDDYGCCKNNKCKDIGPNSITHQKENLLCVMKSPHAHKEARFRFEIRTHQRLIDILHPTAQTIDSFMQLDLPAGVDVEVKL